MPHLCRIAAVFIGGAWTALGHPFADGVCAGAAAPPSRPPGPHPSAMGPARPDPVAEAGAPLERAEAAYRSLRSYRDTAIVRHESESNGNPPDVQSHETHLEFRFARPNLFVLANEAGGAYCDGVRLWLHDARAGVYAESAAPSEVRLDDLDRLVPAVHLASHPVARALLSQGWSPAMSSWRVDELTGRAAEPRDGAPGHRVHAVGRGDIPGQERSAMSLWFSERTGLLGEITVDLTGAFHAANGVGGAGAPVDARGGIRAVRRVTLTTRLTGVHLNEPMSADQFAFRPRPADRRADQITSPGERARAAQDAMIGRAAPPIEQPILGKGPFTLSETTGRVVVLYFWDTGCTPSVDALPRVQALADRFRKEPVTVLGVNQDPPAAEERVRRCAARAGVSIGQIMDGPGAAARGYALTAIPCTVLIDKAGIIRAIEPGPIAGRDDAIASDIHALLRGETLDDPDALARRSTGSR